ncbi:hypothetical protein ECANGB1_2741 [Enterospora canceri]|uniref:Uncharacterized protein n=1 Tax=Enterospora canceri TaxID=1081671 RepID=A0A1Y1S462_9MICR|nr:hypothetical protein ECANGB1_2741 [Enterospora canceri]
MVSCLLAGVICLCLLFRVALMLTFQNNHIIGMEKMRISCVQLSIGGMNCQ